MQKAPLVSTLCVLVCVVFVFNALLSGVVVMCLMLLGVGDVAKTNNNGIDEWMGVVCGQWFVDTSHKQCNKWCVWFEHISQCHSMCVSIVVVVCWVL